MFHTLWNNPVPGLIWLGMTVRGFECSKSQTAAVFAAAAPSRREKCINVHRAFDQAFIFLALQ